MGKKKNGSREISDELLSALNGLDMQQISLDKLQQASDAAFSAMSEQDRDKFEAMMYMAMMGIDPAEYAQFYAIFEKSGEIASRIAPDEDPWGEPMFQRGSMRNKSDIKEYQGLPDAENLTLVLKIQMKDVAKPPMWREVEVPADYDFSQLQEIIQNVVGLENYHLWQFNKHAYDDSLLIGMSSNNSSGGPMEFVTHEANETPLTVFLQKKGDKLEYVYDFGDDWIFNIEVKDVLNKKTEIPKCTKYKSELNAMEDSGGVWSYISAREDLENWGSLTKKEQKNHAANHGFDNIDDYLEYLNENRINLDCINECLSLI